MDDTDPLRLILNTSFLSNYSLWIEAIILLLLIFSSAMISASEVAFFSLSPDEKDQLQEGKIKNSELILKIIQKPKELLATILISNNFVNIGIIILSSYVFGHLYPKNPEIEGIDYLRTITEIGGITFILLLLGEVTPKVYANKNSLQLASTMAKPLKTINNLPPFSWLRKFLVDGTEIILKYARKKQIDVDTDDLEAALALTKEEDVSASEQKILEGIVSFGNKDVRQIMKSRVDTIAVNQSLNYEELMEVILESGYSRIPVYEETFDNIKGVLYVKDLLKYLDQPADFKWINLVRPALFVPENKKLDDLLKEFQEKKMHIAVIVDEYGGSSGIATMEDILEEIVGEITDEFDDEDIVYTKINDSTFLFEGKTSLIDMYKVLDIDGKNFEEAKGESDSIGGFLIEHSGRIMKNNEYLIFENLKFIVEASDKKRVKMVKVIKFENEE